MARNKLTKTKTNPLNFIPQRLKTSPNHHKAETFHAPQNHNPKTNLQKSWGKTKTP